MSDDKKGLLGITEEGHVDYVPNSYEGIKAMLRGGTLSMVVVSSTAAYYIDDDGMLNNSRLNFPASLFAGRVIYGPVVMVYAVPDEEGDSLPPSEHDVEMMSGLCDVWHQLEADAERNGQSLVLTANPDTVPPPQFIVWEGGA